MSQATGLFSVRRPRETLGPITNHSSIPQPASAMKRASSSYDMRNAPYTASHVRATSINHSIQRPAQPNFHRSSSGGNLAELGMSTMRRSVSNGQFGGTSHRQSLAPNQLFGSQTPMSTSVQRRSSIYSRPSGAAGPVHHQSFFSQPAGPASGRVDTRPIRDRAYRERIGQELLDYLTQNNFELEMKHSLTSKAMVSPTQKDFNLMFQWLYNRIDPGYKFQKSIDTEIPIILKQLRYPYADTMTKSQFGMVNSSNWPRLLLMLHWIMQLAQMLDNFTRGDYDDACAEAGVDVSADRIVFRFLFGAYQDWLQMGPDDDDESAEAVLVPHVQAMTREFERISSKYDEELKIYEAENESLKAQIEEFEKTAPDVAKLDKHFKILEDDKKKFEDYNANVQAKIEKYQSRIQILEAEISKTETELETAEQERQSLQQSVDKQGLNIQEIDRMNTERERLTKSHEDIVLALDEVNKRALEKETESSQKLEDLEAAIKRYNSLSYQMSLIPSTASNAKGQNFEVSLNLTETTQNLTGTRQRTAATSSTTTTTDSTRLLPTPTTGYNPSQLLSLDLRGTIRPALLTLRKQISQRRTTLAQETFENRDTLDKASEVLQEKSNEVENLSYRVSECGRTYTTLKEDSATKHTQQTGTIEKLEKELGRIHEGLERGVAELQRREVEVQVLWENMQEEALKVRETLHVGVDKVLNDVVRFKMHVQKGLEEYEGWVAEELEGEWLDGAENGVSADGLDVADDDGGDAACDRDDRRVRDGEYLDAGEEDEEDEEGRSMREKLKDFGMDY